MATTVRILLGAAMLITATASAGAGEDGCANCGATEGLRRVCRPICTTKHVEYVVWESVCEEFCVPLSASDVAEGRSKIRSRNKLMKKTLVAEVPVVKWVVDYVCDQCESQPTLEEQETPPAAMPTEANRVQRSTGGAFRGGDRTTVVGGASHGGGRTTVLGGLLADQLIEHGFVATRNNAIPAR